MAETTPTHISSASRYMGGMNYRAWAGGTLSTSTAWGTANLAWYIPFSLPWSYTVQRLFIGNGSTVSGNTELGVYRTDGTRLATTGAVAQAGTTALQYLPLAAVLTLAAGNYFVAVALSSATGTVLANATVTTSFGRMMGLYQQATALPLPAAATFAAWASAAYPLVGITRTSSGY